MIVMIDYDNRQLSLMGFIMVIIIYCHRLYNPSRMDNHHYNNRDFDNVQIFFPPILPEGDEELRFAVPQVGVGL